MSGPAHTPGPWRVSSGDETRVFSAMAEITRAYSGGMSGVRIAEAEANARLIAAAPELLEAAAELERYLRETPHHNSVQAAKVRAVLAKARGEA